MLRRVDLVLILRKAVVHNLDPTTKDIKGDLVLELTPNHNNTDSFAFTRDNILVIRASIVLWRRVLARSRQFSIWWHFSGVNVGRNRYRYFPGKRLDKCGQSRGVIYREVRKTPASSGWSYTKYISCIYVHELFS